MNQQPHAMADEKKSGLQIGPGDCERYINPYTDFGFKKLFGTEMNKDLLMSFLNSLFGDSGQEIIDLEYLTNEHLGDGYGDRRAIFDVYCKTATGKRFIVEMQQAEIAQYTPAERREYEASVRNYWDYYSTVTTAHDKGRAEGMELGRAEGMELSRAEGMELGKRESARRMKSKGFAVADIAEITGLSLNEILNL